MGCSSQGFPQGFLIGIDLESVEFIVGAMHTYIEGNVTDTPNGLGVHFFVAVHNPFCNGYFIYVGLDQFSVYIQFPIVVACFSVDAITANEGNLPSASKAIISSACRALSRVFCQYGFGAC